MLRLSRRFTTALLWLAIVLLPVRVGAAVMMPLAMPGMTPPAAAATQAPTAAALAMPCHGATQDESAAAPDAPSCALCDLCHTTVAQAPTPLAMPAAPHDEQPRIASAARVESRMPDGLFRPPRPVLA